MIYNMHAKLELGRMYYLDAIVFTFIHTRTHAYIRASNILKIVLMNSGDFKAYQYVKISKSNFFMITVLFLNNTYLETIKKALSWTLECHLHRLTALKILEYKMYCSILNLHAIVKQN